MTGLLGADMTDLSFSYGDYGVGYSEGQSRNDVRKQLRTQYRHALQYQPAINRANTTANFLGTVDAAREAGLHPLFALGGGASSGGAPAFAGGTENTGIKGQVSSKAIRAQEAAQVRLTAAQAKYWEAKANEVLWGFEDAKNAAITRANGANNARQDLFQVNPAQVTASDPNDASTEAGPETPGWKLVQYGDPKKWPAIYVMGGQLSENFEDPISAQMFWNKNASRLTLPMLRYFYEVSPAGQVREGVSWMIRRLKAAKFKGPKKPAKTWEYEYEISP